MSSFVGTLSPVSVVGSLVETFTPLLVVDRDAIQTVPNGSGAVALAISSAGGHKDGATKIVVFPIGSATSVVFGSDLRQHGDAFVSSEIYLAFITYVGGVFDTVTRSIPARDVAAPTVSSAIVEFANQDALVVTFSEPVFVANLTGLSLSFSAGTPRTITAVEAGNGTTTVTFTLSGALAGTEVLSFVVGATRTTQDLNGNLLTVGSTSVTNDANAPRFADEILWLRGDNVIQSGTISQWTDKTSNANHLAQATGSKQAGYLASGGPNGTPCGDFDGSNDGYINTAIKVGGVDPPDYTEYTEIVVAKLDVTNADQIFGDTADASAVSESGPRLLYVTGAGVWFTCPANGGNAVIPNGSIDTNWHWYMGIHRGATREIYLDGVLVDTDTNNDNPNAQRAATLGFGRVENAPLNGRIAERKTVGRALSSGELAQLRSYIAARYALAVGP